MRSTRKKSIIKSTFFPISAYESTDLDNVYGNIIFE